MVLAEQLPSKLNGSANKDNPSSEAGIAVGQLQASLKGCYVCAFDALDRGLKFTLVRHLALRFGTPTDSGSTCAFSASRRRFLH